MDVLNCYLKKAVTAIIAFLFRPYETQWRLFDDIEPFKRTLSIPLLFEKANEQWFVFSLLYLGSLSLEYI